MAPSLPSLSLLLNLPCINRLVNTINFFGMKEQNTGILQQILLAEPRLYIQMLM